MIRHCCWFSTPRHSFWQLLPWNLSNPILYLWVKPCFHCLKIGWEILFRRTVKLIWHPAKGMWRVLWLKETSHPFCRPVPTSERRTYSRHCHFSNEEWLHSGSLPSCAHLFPPSCAATFTYNSEQLAPWLWFCGCVLGIDQDCKIIGLQDWWKLWIISWRGK